MFDYEKNKYFQVDYILQIIKLASLAFSGVAFFQYFFEGVKTYALSGVSELIICFVLASLLAVYLVINFLQQKKQNYRNLSICLERIIFLVISLLLVMLTGSYRSNYKFLFIFVIISTSIECSMKTGLFISSVSSLIILGIDLIFSPKHAINVNFESDLVLVSAFIIISWIISFYVKLLNQYIEVLKNLVNKDGLTGLYNHRYFYERLTKLVEDSQINNKSLALLFIDIDYFKHYNDLNGHQKGDQVLKDIADILTRCTRKNDVIARYGGEEFAVLLSSTSERDALEIAEKIRYEVHNFEFPGQEYVPNQNLTVSIGVSAFPSKAKTENELVKCADAAMYRAKFLRKNRVELYYSILDDLQNDIDDDDKEIIASIKTLIAVINAKDKYTYKHIERVVSYCTLMADNLNLSKQDKKKFIYAAYMHDIGKISIPEEVLNKMTPLTNDEWNLLKKHPFNGVQIIKKVSVLKDVIPIILEHHEHYDGSGYPSHLKGNKITYLARMLTVADSFDAMTSNRPYQNKKSYNDAYNELIRCSGTQFDPDIVKQFISIMKANISDVQQR